MDLVESDETGLFVLWLFHGLIQDRNGFVEVALDEVNVGDADVRVDKVFVGFEDLVVDLKSLWEKAEFLLDKTEVEQGDEVVGSGFDRLGL